MREGDFSRKRLNRDMVEPESDAGFGDEKVSVPQEVIDILQAEGYPEQKPLIFGTDTEKTLFFFNQEKKEVAEYNIPSGNFRRIPWSTWRERYFNFPGDFDER